MKAYIISQIAAALSTIILLTYSVLKVNRRVILICNIIINSLLTLHYYLLCSYTGAVCSGITTVMVCVYYYKESIARYKVPIFNLPLIPTVFVCFFIVSGVLTWTDLWSCIPIIGNILLVIALWNDNETKIKFIFIIVGILWIIYNAHLKSVANVIGQVMAVTSNLIYMFRVFGLNKGKRDLSK